MLRRLVLFLALLLPLQFAWAGASSYCQHESDPVRTGHFGHHEHAHHDTTGKAPVSKLAGDSDCGTCHSTSAPSIVDLAGTIGVRSSTSGRVPFAELALSTALSRAPDRPQWRRLA